MKQTFKPAVSEGTKGSFSKDQYQTPVSHDKAPEIVSMKGKSGGAKAITSK